MSEVTGLAEKLTRVYLKIRDEKAKLSAEYKEKEASLNLTRVGLVKQFFI